MPLPHIWSLQMKPLRKLQVFAVFLLGWFVVGTGIARCICSLKGVASQANDFDYTCEIPQPLAPHATQSLTASRHPSAAGDLDRH